VAGPRGPARSVGEPTPRPVDPAPFDSAPFDSEAGLDARLLDAIERLAQGRRAFVQDIATRRELSPLQIDLLLTLAEQRRTPPLAGQLARHLDVAASTVADAAAALRRKGLLTERPDPADGRRRLLSLTARGTEVAGEVLAERYAALDALAALAASDRAAALEVVLTLVAQLHDRGVIAVDRSCKTCRFRTAGPGGDWCALLDQPLRSADLRVDCPEHEASPAG
jgi:DNA-binding MarR family transcriptional regulator